MGELSARNFGLLIAYVLPGFVLLWGLGFLSPTVSGWLSGGSAAGPSVGGFLYVFLASIGCGMTASALRWAALDAIHHRTGLRFPFLNFATITEKLQGFERIVQDHYQYYQFYGNTLIAMLGAYPLWRSHSARGGILTDAVFVILEVVFFAASRNALRTFYRRATQLLGESEVSDDERIWRRQAPRSHPDSAEETGDSAQSSTEDGCGGEQPSGK